MGTIAYPLVRGHRYSFASIELSIEGKVYLGVTSIDYAEQVSPTAIYGRDPARVGRSRGKHSRSASVEMLREEFDQIRIEVGGAAALGRVRMTFVVSYSELRFADLDPKTLGVPQVITDRVIGYVIGTELPAADGADATTVKITIDPTAIEYGVAGAGSANLEADNDARGDGSFWLLDDSGVEGPDYAPNPWDTVIVGVDRLPGICSVKGLPTLAFDKKKAGGVDGATITVNGYLPGPIDIECRMWTRAQWEIFKAMAPRLWRKPNKKQKAADLKLPIVHPSLAVWGITDVVILGVSVAEQADAGVMVAKLKAVEYVPLQAVNRTATAKSSAKTVPIATELDPARNRVGDSPGKTDIKNPKGPPTQTKGGVS